MKFSTKLFVIINLIIFLASLICIIVFNCRVDNDFFSKFAQALATRGMVPEGKDALEYAKELTNSILICGYVISSVGLLTSLIGALFVFNNVQSMAIYITLGILYLLFAGKITGILLIIYGAGNYYQKSVNYKEKSNIIHNIKEEKNMSIKVKTVYHVSKRDDDGKEWKVFIENSDKVIKLFKTQQEALDYAKTLCKNKDDGSYVVLHGLDGKIRKF